MKKGEKHSHVFLNVKHMWVATLCTYCAFIIPLTTTITALFTIAVRTQPQAVFIFRKKKFTFKVHFTLLSKPQQQKPFVV